MTTKYKVHIDEQAKHLLSGGSLLVYLYDMYEGEFVNTFSSYKDMNYCIIYIPYKFTIGYESHWKLDAPHFRVELVNETSYPLHNIERIDG